MRNLIDQVRRLVVVCAIVLGTGAMSCQTADQDVKFVAGYGYVVSVRHENFLTGSDKGLVSYYFVFDTEEEARRWAYNFRHTPDKMVALNAPGPRRAIGSNTSEYDKLTDLLQSPSVVPGDPVRTIDQVVPPVPTAPAPQ